MQGDIKAVRISGATVFMSIAALLTAALPHLVSRLPPQDELPIFYRLFFYNDAVGSLAMLLALLLALSLPKARDAMIRLAAWIGEHPGRVAAATFIFLALGARFIYLSHPFAMDESAPVMQAHAFAQGQLTANYPVALLDLIIPPGFQGYFMMVNHQTGGVISVYWPGLALLQTPFARLGLDWCLNPAFGALALFMMHRLAGDIVGQPLAGGWAMLVALASPQFTINAMSYYAMPGELALNLLFLWLLLRSSWKSAFAAGLIGGLALVMHNPMPHILMALPCLLWLAWRRARWDRLAAVLLGYVPLGLGLGLGWWFYVNNFTVTQTGMLGADRLGLLSGIMVTLGKILTFPTGSMVMARWLAAWKIWIWACPGLLLALFGKRQSDTRTALLIAAFTLTFIVFLFVPFDQGHGWGYRYIHPAWGALPVVAGAWLAGPDDRLQRWGGGMVLAGLLATPIFLWQTHATIKHELSYRLTTPDTGNWIVFIAQDTPGGYKGDLVQNPPGNYHTRYLISKGAERDRLLMTRYFPHAREVRRDYRGSVWKVQQDVATWAIQMTK